MRVTTTKPPVRKARAAAPDSLPGRIFMILPPRERNTVTKTPRKDRRSWTAILDALLRGDEVFIPEDEISDDGKYLRTALGRRGRQERLRTMLDVQDLVFTDGTQQAGVAGRRLWIER